WPVQADRRSGPRPRSSRARTWSRCRRDAWSGRRSPHGEVVVANHPPRSGRSRGSTSASNHPPEPGAIPTGSGLLAGGGREVGERPGGRSCPAPPGSRGTRELRPAFGGRAWSSKVVAACLGRDLAAPSLDAVDDDAQVLGFMAALPQVIIESA